MTAGKDGIIQIYTTEIEELLQIAKSQVARQLTAEEKRSMGCWIGRNVRLVLIIRSLLRRITKMACDVASMPKITAIVIYRCEQLSPIAKTTSV